MTRKTMMRITKEILKELEELKLHKTQSYAEVVKDLIDEKRYGRKRKK